MQRRNFLKKAAVLPIPFLLGRTTLSALSLPALESAMNAEDRVLVLLQLTGGNDGLNTVIPLDQYAGLMEVRGNLAIPENEVLQIEDTIGLHPAMAGMRSVYDAGRLAVIQGVGYPEQNRSHFRSTDILNTASASDEVLTTGWLGRHLDERYPGFPGQFPTDDQPDPFAIVMGSSVSETCQGRAGNFSMALTSVDNVGQLPDFPGSADLSLPYGRELDWLRTTISQSNQYAGGIERAADMGNNMVDYPGDNQVAAKLRDVARLISGGLKTKIYIVELGGFDTHADQVATDTTTGVHANLLQTLSDAVASFQEDLVELGLQERVLGMTYSEFGRRIRSNGSVGSDHGDAAPMFLFGACVSGGVTGTNAEVPADVSQSEGVPMQYDFRNVYGSVLVDWFGVAEGSVRSLIIDDFAYLPIISGCSDTNSISGADSLRRAEFAVQPNPAREEVQVILTTKRERVRVVLFDTFGRQVRTIADRGFVAGEHRLSVSLAELPAGTYFVHVMLAGGRRGSRRVVKL